MPLFGLGCVAGAAGVARLHDYLPGTPTTSRCWSSVELCSLTVQRDDVSVANLVASGLFGDGAAAVVAVGADRGRPRRDRSTVLGVAQPALPRLRADDGLGRRQRPACGSCSTPQVPDLVRRYLGEDVDGFLADHGLTRARHRLVGLPPRRARRCSRRSRTPSSCPGEAVELTWDSLARIGNLSSASVLHVLEDTLRDRPPRPGSYGLLMAMGPGFCSELVLLRRRGRRGTA